MKLDNLDLISIPQLTASAKKDTMFVAILNHRANETRFSKYITKLLGKMTEVETVNDRLSIEINRLESEIDSLDSENDRLEAENNRLESCLDKGDQVTSDADVMIETYKIATNLWLSKCSTLEERVDRQRHILNLKDNIIKANKAQVRLTRALLTVSVIMLIMSFVVYLTIFKGAL